MLKVFHTYKCLTTSFSNSSSVADRLFLTAYFWPPVTPDTLEARGGWTTSETSPPDGRNNNLPHDPQFPVTLYLFWFPGLLVQLLVGDSYSVNGSMFLCSAHQHILLSFFWLSVPTKTPDAAPNQPDAAPPPPAVITISTAPTSATTTSVASPTSGDQTTWNTFQSESLDIWAWRRFWQIISV